MNRRTVSNLSRETKVSRQTIYKKIKELNIRYENKEFTPADYEKLTKELSAISVINKSKKTLPEIDAAGVTGGELAGDEQSTLRERLRKAKDEYNYNNKLIRTFQAEADEHFKIYRKTTAVTHNGTEAAIPAIMSLEKYVKLNIALSKLISDLEADLDLTEADESDPFG